MKPLEVNLLGRSYQIACPPGEEDKVRELATLVEEKMTIAAQGGQGAVGEVRLFLLAALMLADELVESRSDQQNASDSFRRQLIADEDLMVAAVDHLAGRVSALAARIENP